MSFLFGAATTNTATNQAPVATGIPIQTSVYGKPVTIAYGQSRGGGNLIEYDNFNAVAVNNPSSSSGGGGGKASGGGSCFAGETLISTPFGPRRIDTLGWGDLLWSFDPATGKRVVGLVTERFQHSMGASADKMLRVYVREAGLLGWIRYAVARLFGAAPCLRPTTNHYLWIDGVERREAKDWRAGDALVAEDGSRIVVARIERAPDELVTWNLTVEPHHNFFAIPRGRRSLGEGGSSDTRHPSSAPGILAHNGSSGGGNKGTTTTNYFADLAIGICEGPIAGIGAVWKSESETTAAADSWTVFEGTYPQSVWKTEAYAGLAYAAELQYALGTSPNLPNFNWEIYGFFHASAPSSYGGGGDADPSLVVPDLLSNAYYGAGFPASRCGTLDQANEAHTIPSSGPYTVTVTNAAAFSFNLDVVDGSGNIYACVASSPGALQYSFDPATGVYSFAAANAGTAVTIRYAWLSALDAYQSFTLASGLWVSPIYDSQTQASSMLDDLATATYAEFVWSSGVLTMVPRGTVSVSGNGYSWTAPSAPLFDLTDDDFLPNTNPTGTVSAAANDDPVIVSRSRPSDQINDLKIEFLDRANQYAPSIAEVADQANIDAFGKRAPASKTVHLFCDANAANVSAQLQMQDQYIRNMYSFTLDQRYCVLDPMDIVTLTDSYLGLSQQWVRVTEITENDDGTLSITAEEYPTGTGAAASYALNTGSGYAPNYNQDPGPTNAPILFGMPVALASNQGLELACALSGSSTALWGGCDVYVSGNGSSYRLVGRQAMPARMGVTTADFLAGSDPDTTHTLAVDLTQSAGQLVSGTQADADDGNTLCYVGGSSGVEYVSYQQATLTATNKYNLGKSGATAGYLRRGQQGSLIVDHPSGSPFARMDQGLFTIPYTADQIGQTMFLKFTSFNVWGGGEESLAAVTAYEIVLPAPPAPPDVTDFTATQNGNVVVFGWNNVIDAAVIGIDIGYAEQGTTDWSDFIMLTEASAGTEMTNAEVPPGTWVFGARAIDIAGQLSPDITTVELIVTNTQELIADVPQAPNWLATLTNLFAHWTGVLVPLGSKDASAYAALRAPSAPSLSATPGGTMVLRTLYAEVTYLSPTGETLVSAESSLSVLLNNLLVVASPAAVAGATGWNVYVGASSGAETLQNATPLAIGVAWTEPAGGLISGAAVPAENTTGWDVFDIAVPDPVGSGSYISATIDTGYNDDLRVYATEAAAPLPGQSGNANLSLAIDTWLTGQSDPDTFTAWTIGYVNPMRYLRAELIYDPVTPGAVNYITDFTPIVDTAPVVNNVDQVVIASGGTAITFPTPFHFAPQVVATALGGSGLYVTAASVTATQCTFHVWNSAGSDVGGTINYTATGE